MLEFFSVEGKKKREERQHIFTDAFFYDEHVLCALYDCEIKNCLLYYVHRVKVYNFYHTIYL